MYTHIVPEAFGSFRGLPQVTTDEGRVRDGAYTHADPAHLGSSIGKDWRDGDEINFSGGPLVFYAAPDSAVGMSLFTRY